MINPDYQRMESFASILELVDDHARAWQAVVQSESCPLGDPSLKYKKQEALEATAALKEVICGLADQLTPEAAMKTEEQMIAEGWTPVVYNGIKSYMRMSDTTGPSAEDGGVYCERCDHFYVGENRCPRH